MKNASKILFITAAIFSLNGCGSTLEDRAYRKQVGYASETVCSNIGNPNLPLYERVAANRVMRERNISPDECFSMALKEANNLRLCETELSGNITPHRRTMLQSEIKNRDLDCQSLYPSIIQKGVEENRIRSEQDYRANQSLIEFGKQIMTPPQTQSRYGLKSDTLSGFSRICVYSSINGEKVNVVPATSLCPLIP